MHRAKRAGSNIQPSSAEKREITAKPHGRQGNREANPKEVYDETHHAIAGCHDQRLVALSASPALAEGTSAGDTITNNVSVSFDVGGVTQTAVTDSDTFTVDRKVNVTVQVDASPVSVTPGKTNAVLAFEITNLSNDTVDYQLSALADAGNPAGLSNIRIYLDADGDGVLDFGELAAGPITYLDDMAEDETRQVLVVGDIALSAVNTNEFDVVLTADARDASGNEGSPGAALANTVGANTSMVDTVLADGAGDSDNAEEATSPIAAPTLS